MDISIIGYGRMGKTVEKVAIERGHGIASIIDPKDPKATHKTVSKGALANADLCIEFTGPGSAPKNIEEVSALGKNIVVGSTGWYDSLEKARKTVEKNKTGLIYSSNFSIGMNIFLRVVEHSAKIMDRFPEYDAAGIELHHTKKADSPSGTAKTLAEIMLKNISRKKKANYERTGGPIGREELHFASVRAGSIPGTHTIIFDSAADTIELTHTARNREGFALVPPMGDTERAAEKIGKLEL